MLPYEGIRTRRPIEGHPESCRVRPHSKTWGGLGGTSSGSGSGSGSGGGRGSLAAGGGASVVRSALSATVPHHHTHQQHAPGGGGGGGGGGGAALHHHRHGATVGARRAVLLPMGPVVPSLSPTTAFAGTVTSPASGDDNSALTPEEQAAAAAIAAAQPVTALTTNVHVAPLVLGSPPAAAAAAAAAGGVSPFKCRSPVSFSPRSAVATQPPRALVRRVGGAAEEEEGEAVSVAELAPRRRSGGGGGGGVNHTATTSPEKGLKLRLSELSAVSASAPDGGVGGGGGEAAAAGCFTPRFHCPRNVDCTQGSGPQRVEGFAGNPDEGCPGVDQALEYSVSTQLDECFMEPPAIDHEGTLFFTPSVGRSGVVRCAAMVTDHAAICGDDFKRSAWLGFTVTIQPRRVDMRGGRDWKAFQSKMTAPVGAVPAAAAATAPPPVSPGGGGGGGAGCDEAASAVAVASSPTAAQQQQQQTPHTFRPCDVTSLRTTAEPKWSRCPAVLLAKQAVPLKMLTFSNEIRSLCGGGGGGGGGGSLRQQQQQPLPEAEVAARERRLCRALGVADAAAAAAAPAAELRAAAAEAVAGRGAEAAAALVSECEALGKLRYREGRTAEASALLRLGVRVCEGRLGVCGDAREGGEGWVAAVRGGDAAATVAVASSLTLLSILLKHRGALGESVALLRAAGQALAAAAAAGGGGGGGGALRTSVLLQVAEIELMANRSAEAAEALREVGRLLRIAYDEPGEGEGLMLAASPASAPPPPPRLPQPPSLQQQSILPPPPHPPTSSGTEDDAEGAEGGVGEESDAAAAAAAAVAVVAAAAKGEEEGEGEGAEEEGGVRAADALYLMGVCQSQTGGFAAAQKNLGRCLRMRQAEGAAAAAAVAAAAEGGGEAAEAAAEAAAQAALAVVEVRICRARVHDVAGKLEQCVGEATEAVEAVSAWRAAASSSAAGGGADASSSSAAAAAAELHLLASLCLATAHVSKGQYAAATPLLERACGVADQHRGGSGAWSLPLAGCSHAALGAFLCAQRRFAQAAPVLEHGLQQLAAALGRDHPLAGAAEAAYAWLLHEQAQQGGASHDGAATRAREFAAHAEHALREVADGAEVRSLARECTADLLLASGNARSALTPYLRAYTAARALPGAESALRPLRLMPRIAAAHCRTWVAPDAAVTAAFEEHLRGQQRRHGEWHQATCPALQCAAELAYAAGDYVGSARLFAKMLTISDTHNMLFLLGSLFKPAAQLEEEQVNERNRLAADRAGWDAAPAFAVVLLQLAAVQEAQQLWAEAEASYLQARAAFEIANHPDHPGVCSALNGIGRILYNAGMYGDALSYFHKTIELASEDRAAHADALENAQQCIRIVNTKLQALHYLLERYEVWGGSVCARTCVCVRLGTACACRYPNGKKPPYPVPPPLNRSQAAASCSLCTFSFEKEESRHDAAPTQRETTVPVQDYKLTRNQKTWT